MIFSFFVNVSSNTAIDDRTEITASASHAESVAHTLDHGQHLTDVRRNLLWDVVIATVYDTRTRQIEARVSRQL